MAEHCVREEADRIEEGGAGKCLPYPSTGKLHEAIASVIPPRQKAWYT